MMQGIEPVASHILSKKEAHLLLDFWYLLTRTRCIWRKWGTGIWGLAGPPVNFWRPKPSLSHGGCKEASSCWEVPGEEGLRPTVSSISGPPGAVLFSQTGHEA